VTQDIGRYQRPAIAEVLKRAGMLTGEPPWHDTPTGWRRGPCVLCYAKTPSKRAFAYREDTGRWRCFECRAGGNAWDLVMALEGCDFYEALTLWRQPAESPEAEDSDSDRIGHDLTLSAGPPCPACEGMYRAGGISIQSIMEAHQQASGDG
jgi:CHC2-type zinc finger protein